MMEKKKKRGGVNVQQPECKNESVKRRSACSALFVTMVCTLFLVAPALAGSITYTYDDAGRLLTADYGNDSTIEYTYDNAGNLLARTIAPANPANIVTANFTAANTCFCTNVTFSANITGGTPPYTYRWDFDNDSIYELEGDLPTPTWHYDSPGTYAARLNVTDNNGSSNETTKLVMVYAIPTADFVFTDVCYCTGTYFVDCSAAGDGEIVSWFWDFGDGDTAYEQNVSHHYAAPGVYVASLTVIDEYGCMNTTSRYVTVFENPIADFEATKVKIGEDTVFTSSVTGGTPPYSYSWDFGDGNTSTEANPTYRYTAPGTYNASLTVVDAFGCSDTFIRTVEVQIVPHTYAGVAVDIELVNATEIASYVPPGTDLSNAVVIKINVTDDTPGNATDDAYTDLTIEVGALDIATCTVFKEGSGFLLEVDDVTTLPTVKPPGVAKFARDLANNSVIVRLYVGDPLLAVVPPLGEGKVFDTGKGSYPSISGSFNGTITPNQTISVSTLYTYACAGTGGHTEYAKIYNQTWSIETVPWNGYVGDWHNLTFNSAFALYENETYNYTISTGSYPQIIHEPSWNATGGAITCTSFEDANGNIHKGWIPAIRLFSDR
jgi:YD repeat-containing protein